MLRTGLLLAVVLSSFGHSRQTSVLITPTRPVTTGWEMTKSLPTGRSMKLRFELRSKSRYVDGPRVVVPCVGPSEEALLRGWRDDSDNASKPAPDIYIVNDIKFGLKVGGQAARQLMMLLMQEQTRIESEITQLYRGVPGQGEGPRPEEQVFRYRYQQMELHVLIEGRQYSELLNTFYVPVSTPVLESKRPCGSAPQEACLIGSIGTVQGGSVSETLLPGLDYKPDLGYIGAVFEPAVAETLRESKFEAVGYDINTAVIKGPDFGAVPDLKWIFLPSGTVLVPGKGGVQSMITVDPLLLKSSSLTNGDIQDKSIAVHCLEIDKDPPTPSTTFTLGRPNDPILRNLATMTAKSAIRGPWDQTRLWIYTDKASLERVNKRLAIGCPPGMYVRSLWEVHTMGGLKDADLNNPALFKPELLGGVSNRKEAANWFAGVLIGRHREVLLGYLSGGGKEFAELISSSNPLAADQFLRALRLLMRSEHEDVRLATLKFLDAQDADALKKAIGRPLLDWAPHIEREGDEASLAEKLRAKLG